MTKEIEDKIGLIIRPCVMNAALSLSDAEFKRLIVKMYACSRGKETKYSDENETAVVQTIYEMEKPFLEYNLRRFLKNNDINDDCYVD